MESDTGPDTGLSWNCRAGALIFPVLNSADSQSSGEEMVELQGRVEVWGDLLPFREASGACRPAGRQSIRGSRVHPQHPGRSEGGDEGQGWGIRIPGSSRHPIFQLGALAGSPSILPELSNWQ